LLTRAGGGLPGRPLDAVLTVREVAARLRISTATVYAMCRRGELGHYRVSNGIRVPETALRRYLALGAGDDNRA
jgi:excisionase family DNA binding protein